MKKIKSILAVVLFLVFAGNFSFANIFLDELTALFVDIGINLAADIMVNEPPIGLSDLFDDDDSYYSNKKDNKNDLKFSREKSNRLYNDGKQAEKEKKYVHALSYYYDAYECNRDDKKADKSYMKLSKKIIYEKVNKNDLEKNLKDYVSEHPSKEYMETKKMKEILGTVLFGLGIDLGTDSE